MLKTVSRLAIRSRRAHGAPHISYIPSVLINTPRRNFLKVVDQATVVYRETLGMNRKRLDPGLTLQIPILHKIYNVDMREQQHPLSVDPYTSDNVPVNVGGTLFFQIIDPEKACFSVKDCNRAMYEVGASVLRTTIGQFTFDEVTTGQGKRKIKDKDGKEVEEAYNVQKSLIANVGNSGSKWGIDCTRFEITSFKPQNAKVAHQLELQMEAERKRRENELNTLSVIRTAEGERDSIKERAEGNLFAEKKKADAKQYMIETETKAYEDQINRLSKILGDRSMVAEYLLKQKQIENIGKIAMGPNNTTYFMPSEYSSFKVISDLFKDKK